MTVLKSIRVMLPIGLLALSSCQTVNRPASYRLAAVTGSKTEMTAHYDPNPAGTKITNALAPYKMKVDEVMKPVIGQSETDMHSRRPESLLSNLIADVLRQAAVPHIGRPADAAVMNMGGIRSSLSAGDITYGDIAGILPFENILCLVTMQGTHLKELMANIAHVRGEGVSNLHLEITQDGKLLHATLAGEEIQDEKEYIVATLDYLAEGNDKLTAFKKAQKKECYTERTVRDIFVEYVARLAAQNKKVTSKIEGRITVK